jgi:hypothetical protein
MSAIGSWGGAAQPVVRRDVGDRYGDAEYRRRAELGQLTPQEKSAQQIGVYGRLPTPVGQPTMPSRPPAGPPTGAAPGSEPSMGGSWMNPMVSDIAPMAEQQPRFRLGGGLLQGAKFGGLGINPGLMGALAGRMGAVNPGMAGLSLMPPAGGAPMAGRPMPTAMPQGIGGLRGSRPGSTGTPMPIARGPRGPLRPKGPMSGRQRSAMVIGGRRPPGGIYPS